MQDIIVPTQPQHHHLFVLTKVGEAIDLILCTAHRIARLCIGSIRNPLAGHEFNKIAPGAYNLNGRVRAFGVLWLALIADRRDVFAGRWIL